MHYAIIIIRNPQNRFGNYISSWLCQLHMTVARAVHAIASASTAIGNRAAVLYPSDCSSVPLLGASLLPRRRLDRQLDRQVEGGKLLNQETL